MKKIISLMTALVMMTLLFVPCCGAMADGEVETVIMDGEIELGTVSASNTLTVTLTESDTTGYIWKFGNDAAGLTLSQEIYDEPTDTEELFSIPGSRTFELTPTKRSGTGVASFWFSKTWIHGMESVYAVYIPYTISNNRVSVTGVQVLSAEAIPDTVEEQMASDPEFGSITFKSDSLEIYVGKTGTMTPKASSNAISKKGYTYETSDKAVATVANDGKVKGVSQGTAIITVHSKSDDRVWARYLVKVKVAVTKVTVTGPATTLLAGDSMQLFAEVEPANADNKAVTWKSSDKSIATVDENGVVTGLKKGSVSITATSADNKDVRSKSYKIDITQSVTGVTVEKEYVRVGVGSSATVTAKILPTNANNKNMSWHSYDESICTVSGKKNEVKLTGKAWGETQIAGITEDGQYVVTFTALVGSVSKAVKISSPSRSRRGAPVITLKNESNMDMEKVTLVLMAYDDEGANVQLSRGKNPYVIELKYEYTIPAFSSVTVDFNQVFSNKKLNWNKYSYMQVGLLEWQSYDSYTTTSGGTSNHYSFNLDKVSWVNIGEPVIPVNNELDPSES